MDFTADRESEETDGLGWNSLAVDERFPEWKNWHGAVLLSDEIEYYCEHPKYKLIEPFETKSLKPARYQLHMGVEAMVGGEKVAVSTASPLVLQPHQVAIVSTRERLNIPRFLIARWNITVSMAYKGLLWVGALQVDPGWVGYLPCPLYNMSSTPVELRPGDSLFTIDFVRTTPYRPRHCVRYKRDISVNPPLATFAEKLLQSGPYESLKELKSVREQMQQQIKSVDDFRNWSFGLFAVGFAVLGALIAALGVLVVRPAAEVEWRGFSQFSFWPTAALAGSAFAFVVSVFALALTWLANKPRS